MYPVRVVSTWSQRGCFRTPGTSRREDERPHPTPTFRTDKARHPQLRVIGLLALAIGTCAWATDGAKKAAPTVKKTLTPVASAALPKTDESRSQLPVVPDPCAKVGRGETVIPEEQNLDLRFIAVVPEMQQRWDSRDWEEMFKEPEPNKIGVSAYREPEFLQIGPLAPMPNPIQTFAGIGFSDSCTGGRCGGGWPPDTNGDVGANHYVQAVNTAFGVFSKSGALLASTTFNSLWSGANTGTPCDNQNYGDPVVIYDSMGDRWIVTDFAFAFSGGKPAAPCYECIAVSKTPDPVSGGWYLYAVNQSSPPGGSKLMNDYPKFGIWTDGLYQSANMFSTTSGSYWGTAFWAYNRLDLEAGRPVTPIVVSLQGTSTFTMLPANLRIGPQQAFPPVGTPTYLVGDSQSAYAFDVRQFTVDWGAGTASISVPANVAYATAIDPRNPSQPGTTPTLDSLSWRAMVQAQYKRVGTAESLWVNHTVASNSSANDAPQWSQIDVTGGAISTTPVQTQIYQPDSTVDRWMGSLAVDGQGNMALGYSTSNGSSYPSLKYSGRLVGDPLNALPQSETVLYAGTGSQTTYSRWGDYSGMSVDPTDDCTFWYTNEYYATTGTNWQTRIGSFKFPSCTLTSGTLAVTVKDCLGNAVLNAVVNIDGHDYGNTISTGAFNAYLAPGSHTVKAMQGGSSTTQSVTITAGVTSNLTLTLPGSLSPTITPSPAQVCTNSTGNEAAGPAGMTTYAWTISNGTITSATNIQTITFTAGTTGSVALGLSVTNGASCGTTSSSVTINQPPAEATGSTFCTGDKTCLSWSAVSGASGYNLYRGSPSDLPNLLTGSVVNACLKWYGAGTNTGTGVITETPAAGSFYWYLVTATTGSCQGPAGYAMTPSAQPRILNSSGNCP